MKETTENNILLAEFLGATKTDLKGKQKPIWYPILGASHTQLHFHKDWNWLMLVVDKIESLGFSVTIHTDTCYVAHNTDKSVETIIGISDYKLGKLKVVYNACIQFVKWFNSQNK